MVELHKFNKELLGELLNDTMCERIGLEYQSLPDDWDGYGGKAASIEAVMDSVRFLLRFPSTFPLPKPMISGSGVIDLYWEGNGCYASIDFDGSGHYCYIADSTDEENGEDQVPVAQTPPHCRAGVIVMTADDLPTVRCFHQKIDYKPLIIQ